MRFNVRINVSPRRVMVTLPEAVKVQRVSILYDKKTGTFFCAEDKEGCSIYVDPKYGLRRVTFSKNKWAKGLANGSYQAEVDWKNQSFECRLGLPKADQEDKAKQDRIDRNINNYIGAVNEFASRRGFEMRVVDGQLELIKQEIIKGA